MTRPPDASVFYLFGGIGFFIVAIILFVVSPQHDAGTLLPIAGIAVAGVLAIVTYFGTRGRGHSSD